jgi:hypothetical protein
MGDAEAPVDEARIGDGVGGPGEEIGEGDGGPDRRGQHGEGEIEGAADALENVGGQVVTHPHRASGISTVVETAGRGPTERPREE